MAIKREDIKPDARFIDEDGDEVTIVGVGDDLIIYRFVDGYASHEDYFDILTAMEAWNYPEPEKKTRTFYEWIAKGGVIPRVLITKEFKNTAGVKEDFCESQFLQWTDRSFEIEVDW